MASLGISIASVLLILSAPEIFLGDGLTSFRGGLPEIPAAVATLSAARGESELIVVAFRNTDQARTVDAIEVSWDGDLGFPVETYALVPAAVPTEPPRLLPVSPRPIAPDATAWYLLRYHVPPGATAGSCTGTVRLLFDDGKATSRSFTVDVLDFTLPGRLPLTVLLGIDRAAFQAAWGLGDDLDAWRPVYDVLAANHLGFQVWPPLTGETDQFYDFANVDQVKSHLDYAVRLPDLPALEIGGQPGELLRDWPAPALDSPQDPLQFLLYSVMGALEAARWGGPTVLIPSVASGRAYWQDIRLAFARVARADKRVTRLLIAPPHPFFERYTDLWALPWATPASAVWLLRDGHSLIRYPRAELAVSGTAGGPDPAGIYTTAVEDALDGCEETSWLPAVAPEGDSDPVIEVRMANPVQLESLAIIWPADAPREEPVVETAYGTGTYSKATIRWSERHPLTEGGRAISTGTFRYPRSCQGVRLTFERNERVTLGVAEVLFNSDASEKETELMRPVTPWLDQRSGPSEFLTTDAARLLPWNCYTRGFAGILGPVLNPSGSEGSRLVDHTSSGPVPSLALLQLCDGLEDVAYLHQFEEGIASGTIKTPRGIQAWYPPDLGAGANIGEVLEAIRKRRDQLGRVLSGRPIVTRNFGPRR